MKLLVIFGFCLFMSCDRQPVQDFMTGTFVSEADGKYSKASNSLVIRPQDNDGAYGVTYISIYQLKKNGVLQPEEKLEKDMVFFYDAEKKQLEEPKSGKVILFLPEKEVLRFGAKEYRKIK